MEKKFNGGRYYSSTTELQIMKRLGFLLLSFYLGFPSALARPEEELEQIATVLREDRKLVQKIIFKTLFHQIVQRGLLLKELAGERSKEEMADAWKRSMEDTWRRGEEESDLGKDEQGGVRQLANLPWLGGRGVRIM